MAKKTTSKSTASKTEQKGDGGAAEVQATMDAEQEQGFQGEKVDPTPNENYTADGVTSDAPTPETDSALYREARAKMHDGDPRHATEDRGQ